MTLPPVGYKRHSFPPEIIALAVWLYFHFPLSLRLVEEMVFESGILVSYETVRRWALKFGQDFARRLRRKRLSHRDIWQLDKVVVSIGEKRAGSGAPSIKRVMFSTRDLADRPRRRGGRPSAAGSALTPRPAERLCPRSSIAPIRGSTTERRTPIWALSLER
jgi:hypothetical protein